jgi:hypothetical protein
MISVSKRGAPHRALARERDAPVARHDLERGATAREEREQRRVARDRDHRGIDLEEAHAIACTPVGRERARAEPDDADVARDVGCAHPSATSMPVRGPKYEVARSGAPGPAARASSGVVEQAPRAGAVPGSRAPSRLREAALLEQHVLGTRARGPRERASASPANASAVAKRTRLQSRCHATSSSAIASATPIGNS